MNDDHKISFSIDRSKVRQAFKEYTSHYDQQNPRISLKIRHTYRVADLTDRITGSLGLTVPDRDLAWLIGILHDIGSFEQERIYHTLNDAKSTNHARLGADLLFKERPDRLFRFCSPACRGLSFAREGCPPSQCP